MVYQESIKIQTIGRQILEISDNIRKLISESGVRQGLCNIFIHHTSASLLICENADPDVRTDLEGFMQKLVVDGDPGFIHTAEGEDDMPAHIRSVLTQTSITVPINQGRDLLGTWQGVYLWEHRYQAHTRKITITIYGE